MNNKLLKFLLILIVVLGAIGAWILMDNTHSKDVLRLEILGPSEIDAGQEATYTVRYKNNGNFRLEEPILIFEYPENSIASDSWKDNEDEKIIVRGDRKIEMFLEEIQPGEERVVTFKAFIFGKENSLATANAALSYIPRNLSVRYESETSHNSMISSVPFTFEVHLPSRAEPGNRFNFEINYFSRIDYPLSDLRIKINYPSEFELIESKPRPSFENNEWVIPILNKGQGGRIDVSGTLKGDPSQSKVFSAELGFWQDGKFTTLKQSTRGIELATPLIFITQRVNDRPNYIASPGDYLYYEIFFKNTGDDLLENLFLTVRLNEDVIDFNNVQPGSGNFQRNSGMILWGSAEVSQLRFLPTMEEGRVDFWVKVRDDIDLINPESMIEVSMSNIRERFTTKINSSTSLIQKGFFNEGPFNNYGPQPPVVGSSTSYTIKWEVENKNNELKDAKVKAKIDSSFRLSGDFYPQDSKISFDPMSREIVWDIGDMETKDKKETYFQIIFSPQPNQRERIIDIISEARFSAFDSWTESEVSATYRSITTVLPDDSSITDQMGVVR